MSDLDGCGSHGAPAMYLPAAYYISPSDFSGKPPFLSQPPSCQMTFSYASALPGQVQPVGEVPATFRDYAGGGGSSKWSYRTAYSPGYYEEVFHSRDFLQPPARRSDALLKSDQVCGTHPGAAAAAATFYSVVGRNGILPQGFDQFYVAARGGAPSPAEAEPERDKGLKPPPAPRDACSTSSRLPRPKKKEGNEGNADSSSGEARALKSHSAEKHKPKHPHPGPIPIQFSGTQALGSTTISPTKRLAMALIMISNWRRASERDPSMLTSARGGHQTLVRNLLLNPPPHINPGHRPRVAQDGDEFRKIRTVSGGETVRKVQRLQLYCGSQ